MLVSTEAVARAIIVVVLALGGGIGCKQENTTMNSGSPAQSISHDRNLLQAQLKLPAEPLEVSFEEVPRGVAGGLGPTDYLLVALLRFDANTLARLGASSQARPGNPPRISPLANRPWFPVAVKAAIERKDDAGVAIRGRKFDAINLLKAPYATGYFVIVEGTDYVILSAQTS